MSLFAAVVAFVYKETTLCEALIANGLSLQRYFGWRYLHNLFDRLPILRHLIQQIRQRCYTSYVM